DNARSAENTRSAEERGRRRGAPEDPRISVDTGQRPGGRAPPALERDRAGAIARAVLARAPHRSRHGPRARRVRLRALRALDIASFDAPPRAVREASAAARTARAPRPKREVSDRPPRDRVPLR